MNKFRPLLIMASMMLTVFVVASCQAAGAKASIDLLLLAGVWEGTYEYLDPQSDTERIQVPATVIVSVEPGHVPGVPADARVELLHRQPSGSDVSEVRILRYFPAESLIEFDGTWAVTAAEEQPLQEHLLLVFSGSGEDDGRPALLRQSIERLGDILTMRKEVRYDGTDDFFVRDEYVLRQAE